jgi:hypothetical protein
MEITTQPPPQPPPLLACLPQPPSVINQSHVTGQQEDAAPGTCTCLADLPQHIQVLILAHAGAPPWTCKVIAKLAAELQHNPELAALWLTARGIKPLSGAAVRGWWGVCKAILAVGSKLIETGDYTTSLTAAMSIAAMSAGQEEVVNMLHSMRGIYRYGHLAWARSQATPQATLKDEDEDDPTASLSHTTRGPQGGGR